MCFPRSFSKRRFFFLFLQWGPGMLALGLFAAIVTVLGMQINDFIRANDKPSVSTAGVSEAVTHVQSYICELTKYWNRKAGTQEVCPRGWRKPPGCTLEILEGEGDRRYCFHRQRPYNWTEKNALSEVGSGYQEGRTIHMRNYALGTGWSDDEIWYVPGTWCKFLWAKPFFFTLPLTKPNHFCGCPFIMSLRTCKKPFWVLSFVRTLTASATCGFPFPFVATWISPVSSQVLMVLVFRLFLLLLKYPGVYERNCRCCWPSIWVRKNRISIQYHRLNRHKTYQVLCTSKSNVCWVLSWMLHFVFFVFFFVSLFALGIFHRE